MCACTLQLTVFFSLEISTFMMEVVLCHILLLLLVNMQSSLHCKQGMLLVNISGFTCVTVPDRNQILFRRVF